LPPEHTWACNGPAKTAAKYSIGTMFMQIS
jgi:hypothetical protein